MTETQPGIRRRGRLTSNLLARIGQKAGLLTLKERAIRIGLSPGYLAHIERGAVLPSPDVISRIATAYGRDFDDIENAAIASRKSLAQRILEQSDATS